MKRMSTTCAVTLMAILRLYFHSSVRNQGKIAGTRPKLSVATAAPVHEKVLTWDLFPDGKKKNFGKFAKAGE